MATNEQQRRAIGAANEANRRAIGTNNEAARRGLDAAMRERRTGKSQANDINAVVNQPVQRKTLRSVEPRGPLVGTTGTGSYSPPAATGGGIASPLTETEGTRTFHESIIRQSMDGAVFFEVRAAKTVTMTDANGATVIMEYANVTT